MAHVFNILKAWVKVSKGFTTSEDKRRADICNNCTHKKYSKYIDFVNDELKNVKGFVCNDCGCPLIAKIRSNEICKKWKTHTS